VADETAPLAQAYQAYERIEGQLSVALDKLVATNGFADLLATSATNVMALTRMANGTIDRVVRTTRLAARHDVTELGRQLARTEAKLERLLQVVEELQGQLDATGVETPQRAAIARGEVSSIPAPSVTTTPEPSAESAPNGTTHGATAVGEGTGLARASRAAATRRPGPAAKRTTPVSADEEAT
jgi:hypothetical protein